MISISDLRIEVFNQQFLRRELRLLIIFATFRKKLKFTNKKIMKIYHFQQKQLFNETTEEVWDFLSTPKNLDEITPRDLKFEITSSLPPKIYSGLIITYKIKVFPFVKYNWVTEIKSVVPNHYFIDEQRFGPYKFWHHQHKIEMHNGKLLMTDTIHYALPFGCLGKLLHKIFIRKKLEKIFQFRYEYLDKKFNTK